MPYEQHLTIEMDCRNQTKFVSADVEHAIVPNLVDRIECLPESREVGEKTGQNDLTPRPDRIMRLRMLGAKVSKGHVRNNSHDTNISQIEMLSSGEGRYIDAV
jgi:hypothetical protein